MIGAKAVLFASLCASACAGAASGQGFLQGQSKEQRSDFPVAAITDATSLQGYGGQQGGYGGQQGGQTGSYSDQGSYGGQGGNGGQGGYGGGYGSYQQPPPVQSRLEQCMPTILSVLVPIIVLVCICCCIMHLCGDICGCLGGDGSYGPGAMAMAGGAGMLAGYEMDQMRGGPGYY